MLPVLLAPLSALYGLANQINRSRQTTTKCEVPVICIGNVVAGGAGKTPVAIAVAQFLIKAGFNVHFLSRGYGGEISGPERVVQDVHTAKLVGDEPLLLATVAPTWVSKNRPKGAEAAVAAGADVIVMDDGLQNRSLAKSFSILVIDGQFGVGNGRLMPAGPLREKLQDAFAKSNAVVVVEPGTDDFSESVLPVFKAKIVPHALQGELVGERVIAFAGIGRPTKFFNSLKQAGAEIVEAIEFPDHYQFKQNDIMRLVEKAALPGAALVTTRKDYVRLPVDARLMTTVFDIDLVFENPSDLQRLLLKTLGSRENA